MKKLRNILMIIALLASVSFVAAEELTGLYKYEPYNEAPLVRVRYKGSASIATITWDTDTYTVTDGATATAFTNAGSDTVATIIGNITGAKDADDKAHWECKPCASLTTDDIDAADLTAAAAAISCLDGKWKEVLTVDTTALDYNDVSPWQNEREGMIIKQIVGAPGGTGAATVTVYVNDTAIWQTIASTNVPAGVAEVIDISRDLGDGLRIKANNHVTIRCSRTTSTDVGGIGVGYSMDK